MIVNITVSRCERSAGDANSYMAPVPTSHYWGDPCLLCSRFVFFLWTFDFEHYSLIPHLIIMFENMKRHYCTKEDIELNTENITIFLSKRYDFIPHRKRNLKKPVYNVTVSNVIMPDHKGMVY